MKIEDRLADAMHDYTDRIEPEPGSWTRIAARFDEEPPPAPRRPSWRPLVLTAVALAVVVVLIAALVVRNSDGTRVVTEPGGTPSTEPTVPVVPPVGVLVAKSNGEMVVLGTQDGQQHSSLGTFPDVSSVSTTADGRQVFFTSREAAAACGNNPGPVVNRLDPATGRTTDLVGGALSGQVSPDGKFIVYGIWCDGRGPGFTNLLTGENSRSDALGSKAHESSDRIETTEPLAWSPDSKLVLFRLGLKGDPKPHYYVDRLWPAVPQSETKVVALPYGSGISAAAFVDDDTVALAEPTDAKTEVRRWTVSTGPAELPSPVLFEVPGRVISLVSDRSGRHFLALNQAGDLYRWSRGEDQPTKVGSGVAAATWLPWS
jgi:hypothetical protein